MVEGVPGVGLERREPGVRTKEGLKTNVERCRGTVEGRREAVASFRTGAKRL